MTPNDDALLACPFCAESDFDDVGLKIHLENGHCDVYCAIETGPPRTATWIDCSKHPEDRSKR